MSKLVAIGVTGLVGTVFLKEAIAAPALYKEIVAFSRRPLSGDLPSNVTSHIEKDLNKWTEILKNIKADVFYTSLATTRAKAGGFDNQWKLEHDFILEIAKTAKESSGVKTFVIISSAGASADSKFPYMRLKGKTDDEIIDLKFHRTIIVRPGPLVGQREVNGDFFHKFGAQYFGYFRNNFMSRFIGYPVTGEDVTKAINKVIAEPIKAENEVIYIDSKQLYDLIE